MGLSGRLQRVQLVEFQARPREVYRVQVQEKDGSGVAVTLSVEATSWTAAIRRALGILREAMAPSDRDSLGQSEFRVVDSATGHQYAIRSMAELQAHSMREAETPSGRTPMPVAPDFEDPRIIPRRPRPADDLLKTVDNPTGWHRGRDDSGIRLPPEIRRGRLKPTSRSADKGRGLKTGATRGQFARVIGWTNPTAEVSEIVGKAVDMTWDHIPCEAVQCFVPQEDSTCYSVAAARGEVAESVIGSRLELPENISELADVESEPVAVSGESTRFIYESMKGNIVSFEARAILWVPVVREDELVAVLLAMNPKKSAEFTEGDLNGAVYLAATLSKQLG